MPLSYCSGEWAGPLMPELVMEPEVSSGLNRAPRRSPGTKPNRSIGATQSCVMGTSVKPSGSSRAKFRAQSVPPRLTLTAKCAKKQQGWRSSMAEQWFCKPQVGGSIPLASSST